MRLADFIERDTEAILREWETFAAAQLPAAADMDSLALRDHAAQLLRAIVKDISSPQNDGSENRNQRVARLDRWKLAIPRPKPTRSLEQLRVANPGRRIELEVGGDVSGVWDINRLNQLLGNLVVNALKYGTSRSPVKIVLNGLVVEVIFSVHNRGPKIEQSVLAQIFQPLKRGLEHQLVAGRDGSMGLGLYIAREIAIAHHGDISAKSDENETVLTVRLPRLSGKSRP
jgi:signal transduction histidine kinase